MATSACTSAERGGAPMRIVVLASGRGSNLGALLDAARRGVLGAEVVAVFSDRADAGALALARAAGVAARALDPGGFAGRAGFDRALFDEVERCAPDLIVLAGFMRILDAGVVARCAGRMINIHPSLLPKYRGLHTHRRALAAGDRCHGATVHFVTAELDGGPAIAQAVIGIDEGDDERSLAARLLPREHALLVASVALIADGRLRWHDGAPALDGRVLAAPLRLDDENELSAG